ncbi:unnamed protein product, partial [Phaeothamnion confervicola]
DGTIIDSVWWFRDESFRSPLVALGPERKYVTFEPDHGGWNNIR